jgi:hypothetical protein
MTMGCCSSRSLPPAPLDPAGATITSTSRLTSPRRARAVARRSPRPIDTRCSGLALDPAELAQLAHECRDSLSPRTRGWACSDKPMLVQDTLPACCASRHACAASDADCEELDYSDLQSPASSSDPLSCRTVPPRSRTESLARAQAKRSLPLERGMRAGQDIRKAQATVRSRSLTCSRMPASISRIPRRLVVVAYLREFTTWSCRCGSLRRPHPRD